MVIAIAIALVALATLRVISWRIGAATGDWMCSGCGYPSRGLASGICPECGGNLWRAGGMRRDVPWKRVLRSGMSKRACELGIVTLAAIGAYRAAPGMLPPGMLLQGRSMWGTPEVLGELDRRCRARRGCSEGEIRGLLAADDPELLRFAVDLVQRYAVANGSADAAAVEVLAWQQDLRRPWSYDAGRLFEVLAAKNAVREDLVQRYLTNAFSVRACVQAMIAEKRQQTVLVEPRWRGATTGTARMVRESGAEHGVIINSLSALRISNEECEAGLRFEHSYVMDGREAVTVRSRVRVDGYESEGLNTGLGTSRGGDAEIADRLRAGFCVSIAQASELPFLAQGTKIRPVPVERGWEEQDVRVEWSPYVSEGGLNRHYPGVDPRDAKFASIECAYVVSRGGVVDRGHFLARVPLDACGAFSQWRPGVTTVEALGEPPLLTTCPEQETHLWIWAFCTHTSAHAARWQRLEEPVVLKFRCSW